MAPAFAAAEELQAQTEARRRSVSSQLDDAERSRMGQFFTPSATAEFIASLPTLPTRGKLRILDPGAGIGSLTAALVSRVASERPELSIELTAVELDPVLIPELEETLEGCQRLAHDAGFELSSRLVRADFLEWASSYVGTLPLGGEAESFDIVILNPPYRKLNTGTKERRALERIGVDVCNLYGAFLALSCAILDTNGQIAAITPRSFANGPYFRSFRRYLFERVAFDRIHLFESRSDVFSGDSVLQENIIFSMSRKHDNDLDKRVGISASMGANQELTFRDVPYSEVIDPKDPDYFVHIVTDDDDAAISEVMSQLPTRLVDLGLEVSTGRVVDFGRVSIFVTRPARAPYRCSTREI